MTDISKAIAALDHSDIASALTLIKHRCMQLHLFKTMHALDFGTRAVGYELAERMETLHHTARDDKRRRAEEWRKFGRTGS